METHRTNTKDIKEIKAQGALVTEMLIADADCITIDTCSLMHPYFPEFTETLVPLLEKYHKQLLIYDKVVYELDGLLGAATKENRVLSASIYAGCALSTLSELDKRGLIYVHKDNAWHDMKADYVFQNFVCSQGVRKAILVITQDVTLSNSLIFYNSNPAVQRKPVTVARIEDYGVLKQFEDRPARQGRLLHTATPVQFKKPSTPAIPSAGVPRPVQEQENEAKPEPEANETPGQENLTPQSPVFVPKATQSAPEPQRNVFTGNKMPAVKPTIRPEVADEQEEGAPVRKDVIGEMKAWADSLDSSKKLTAKNAYMHIKEGVLTVPTQILVIHRLNRPIGVKEVVFHNGVKMIDGNAFEGMTSIEQISFPKKLSWMGPGAFSDCTSLKSADLSQTELITIAKNVFRNCTSLSEVHLPDSLATIKPSAFENCTCIEELDLSSIKTIADNAFKNCAGLRRITFGEGLTGIQRGAFSGCVSLTECILPDNVIYIDSTAFPEDCALRCKPDTVTHSTLIKMYQHK